ncbi:39S ribosomal protein L44, mitochondrial [Clarireedia jacksonii]
MITRYLTEVSTVFNPFSRKAKTARLFLSFLPPDARQTMKIDVKALPRASKEPSFVRLKFKDGLEMKLDSERLGIKGVSEEVDRHSRILARQAELTGN